jgi:hypothetical protein
MATKIPQVMGLVLCEDFDPHTFSLRRLFQARRFSEFPTPGNDFTVYAALYSGGIEGRMELKCVRMETEEPIYSMRWWRLLPAGVVIQYPLQVRRIQFPAPGRYAFKLGFENTELALRYLEIIRERS